MSHQPRPSPPARRWVPQTQFTAMCAAALVTGAAVHWSGDYASAGVAAFLVEFATGAPLAAAWLIMAFALGWPLRRVVAPRSTSPLALQLGLGIAAALALVSILGTVGWPGGRAGAITLLVGGIVTALVQGVRQRPRAAVLARGGDVAAGGLTGPWLGALLASPALVALAVAATSSPGWLWSTEFGGYDALSYHLQMPREWMAIGRIVPLEHCVYAAMPNAVESAFLHLMLVRGDALGSGVACQFLHAGLALAAAMISGSAARMWAQRAGLDWPAATTASVTATALVLATPWTVVVGSLAYSEMAMAAMFATGLLILGDREVQPMRAGAAIGLCAAVACAAKLSAVGIVSLPLVGVALLTIPRRSWIGAGAVGAIVGAAVLAPWLVRNALVCGSPTFPFLSSVFGHGWWSAEQSSVWSEAHHGTGVPMARLWSQWLGFGLGSPPVDGEPWRAQWALLPWLGLTGVAALVIVRRRAAVPLAIVTIGAPLLFWLVATHAQSRFLVPTIVPLAIWAAVAASLVGSRGWRLGVAAGVALLAFWPLAILRGERDGAPAAAIAATPLFTGDALLPKLREAQRSAAARRAMLDAAPPPFWINHALGADAHVLLVGHATAWYFDQGEGDARATVRWHSVWDRGPLSRAIAAHPDAPGAWRSALRDEGFTHALVDLAMIDRWRRSGWADPALSQAALDEFIGSRDRIVAAPAVGIVLIHLGDRE